MVPQSLRRLLDPRSIAIMGASNRSGSLARTTMEQLLRFGFQGAIHPINPKYNQLQGMRCYPSLATVQEPLDLVLILVPATEVPRAVAQCVEVHAAAAVIFSSGFAERGGEGQALQTEIAQIAQGGGLRLLGPNCQGLFFRPSNLVATFSSAIGLELGADSGVAYIGQSGAVGGSFLSLARERGIGLTAWVSTGNQADLTVTEVAGALLETDLGVLALYLEALPDGGVWHRFTDRAGELGKRVVVLRSGWSSGGQRAAASHTGAMIGDDEGFNLLSSRAGVIFVNDLNELVDAATMLAPGKVLSERAVAVVTSSGGAGALAADHIAANGLELAEFQPETMVKLRNLIPDYGSVGNPIDVTAQLFASSASAFGTICNVALSDPRVCALLVVLTSVTDDLAVRVAEMIADAADITEKPVAVVWLAAVAQTRQARDLLQRRRVPLFNGVSDAVRTVARMAPRPAGPLFDQHAVRIKPSASSLAESLPVGARVITESNGSALLAMLGIPTPTGFLVHDAREAAQAANSLGAEVVLKIQSVDITHKTDIGGVVVGVQARDAARVYDELLAAVRMAAPNASIDGVIVQQLAAPGLELVIGVVGERLGYPPVVTVGIGGITTAVYSDVVSALAPLGEDDALSLLRNLRGWPLLDGYRGSKQVDILAASSAIAVISQAVTALGSQIAEFEINPLIVYATGIMAVDVLIVRDI